MCPVGVVVRRYMYIDFLILLILLLLYLLFFAAASLLFVHLKKCFSFLFQYFFVIKFYVLNNFFAQYKYTYGQLRASHSSHMKAAHTYCFIHEEAHTNVRFISCDGHQLYDFRERGVDLEVEGMRYIEIHRRPAATYWVRLLQEAEISN